MATLNQSKSSLALLKGFKEQNGEGYQHLLLKVAQMQQVAKEVDGPNAKKILNLARDSECCFYWLSRASNEEAYLLANSDN